MYKNSPLSRKVGTSYLPLQRSPFGQRERKLRRSMHKITTIVFARFTIFILLFLFSITSFAQNKVEMADTMRSNGKIYVVVAVCVTLLIGLFIYVALVDKKISRFEKNKD